MTDKQKEETVYDKAIKNRIARSTGHLRSVKAMVENGRDCSEVLIQLSAVKAEITNTSKEILKQHMRSTVQEAVENKDMNRMKEIGTALDQFF